MNTRSFFVVLSFILGVQITSAQSNSEYGRLLWSGKYTCTGSGFQGMNPHVFMAPFVFEMKVYEKVLIYNNNEKYYYSGMKEAYFIRGRLYKSGTNDVSFLISEQGVPSIYTESVQNVPFVGNVTTTSIVFVNVGDGSNSVVGGYNGGVNYGNGGTNYGNGGVNNSGQGAMKVQYGYKKCNSCSGTGRCSVCHGKGMTIGMYNTGYIKCGPCGGDGKCSRCAGSGQIYGIIR